MVVQFFPPVNPDDPPVAPPSDDVDLNVSGDTVESVETLELSPLDLVVTFNPDCHVSGHVTVDNLVNKGFGSPLDSSALAMVTRVVAQPEARRLLHEIAFRVLTDPNGVVGPDHTLSSLASLLHGMSTGDIAAIPFNSKKKKDEYQRWLFERMGSDIGYSDTQFKKSVGLKGSISADQVVQAVAYLVCLAMVSVSYIRYNSSVRRDIRSTDRPVEAIEDKMAGLEKAISQLVEAIHSQNKYRVPDGDARPRVALTAPGNPVPSFSLSSPVVALSSPLAIMRRIQTLMTVPYGLMKVHVYDGHCPSCCFP